jgi:hypothetical protein
LGTSFDVFESTVPLRHFSSDRCPADSAGHRKTSLDDAARTAWPDITAEETGAMRDRIAGQLSDGRFHYVLVAQRFTPQAEQTIAYLNATSTASFYGVELVRFQGESHTAFEARTIFRPDKASRRSASLTSRAEFMETIDDPEYRSHLEGLLEAVEGLGYRLQWGAKAIAVRLLLNDGREPLTIAWLNPPGLSGWMGLTDVTLGYFEESADRFPAAKSALDAYVTKLSALPGAVPVSGKGMRSWHLDQSAFVANAPALIDILVDVDQAVGE